MKERIASALILIALVLASCANPQAQYPPTYVALGSPPPSIDYAANATAGARHYQDAAATYQAASDRATAESLALTRQAEQATAQAAAIATGTAQAYAIAAAATNDALVVRATESAMIASATREAQAIAATSTAAAQIASFEATLAADEAQRLQQQRQAEAARQRRVELWSSLGYWLVAAASIVALAAGGVWLANWWRHQEPVREVISSGGHILVTGNYHMLPPARPQLEAPPPLALPAPQEAGPIVELPRLANGHVLIAGETGSGKTNAMQAVLRSRQGVVVLDPHDQPGKWSHTVIGGGRDFEAIADYMARMAAMLDERYERLHTAGGDFEPLTVAVDEMPAIISAAGSSVAEVWREWLREGRKVGLLLAIATQSTRVRTLGIEGESDLLDNFAAVLVLGKLAEQRHPGLARGPYPAVLETLGRVRAVQVPLISPPRPDGAERQRRPRVVAPEVPKIETPYGDVTPSEIARVLRMKREGHSLRAIEAAVFDYTGGAAHHKVKAVLQWAATKNGVNGHTVE